MQKSLEKKLWSIDGIGEKSIQAIDKHAGSVEGLKDPVVLLRLDREITNLGERICEAMGWRKLAQSRRYGISDEPTNRLTGVGDHTASRLWDLGIDTIEDLDTPAHLGALRDLDGIGSKKAKQIADSLTGLLGWDDLPTSQLKEDRLWTDAGVRDHLEKEYTYEHQTYGTPVHIYAIRDVRRAEVTEAWQKYFRSSIERRLKRKNRPKRWVEKNLRAIPLGLRREWVEAEDLVA